MNSSWLKLTVYFGESDRVDGQLLSDVLIDLFERHGLHAAMLMRGVEGFGIKHALRSDRFLTLSEDLPLVAVAIDERARIEAMLPEVAALVDEGLMTLERVRLLQGTLEAVSLPEDALEATKLTIYMGRDERTGRRPAFAAVVDHLRGHGLSGAMVLLGVDGMAHGRRERARFFSRNDAVPLMIICVGSSELIARGLPGLAGLLADPILTVERVRVCKRGGVLLSEPRVLPERDDAGLGVWQKLTVYASEHSRHGEHPLYIELIRRLREGGGRGATSVRGIWGFSDDGPPHGDQLFSVRRRVPVLTTIVDRPERIRSCFGIVDEVTDEAGLVTSEMVPALRAVAHQRRFGGLRLARLSH